MEKLNKRSILSWCLYDWACGSFSIIVTTFIFATYFTTRIASNEIVGTYQWANATSLAGLIIALCSPLFGAIADHGGNHKRWLAWFTALAVVSSALLWFAYPKASAINFTLSMVVLGTIGLEIALVFYNAFLIDLVPRKYLGRVSGWGWGAGYLGGIVALAIALVFFIRGHFFGLLPDQSAAVRICGPFVALWYTVFALPLFFFLPERKKRQVALPKAVKLGWQELVSTLKKLPQERQIFLYLIAHMLYADGLNTLFAFGGIYAAGTYHLTFEQVLLFGITMNITAGIGAISLGWLDDFLGSKFTIILSLICLVIFGLPILVLHDKYWFWGAALVLCIFVGPVQSASRSLLVRLIAERKTTAEIFGLYALSGKITAFIGPWLLGFMTLTFNSQRLGMATILVFFALGALLMIPIQVPKKARQALAK